MSREGYQVESAVNEVRVRVNMQFRSRAYRVANELRNASLLVLRGQRSGKQYRVPGTKRYYSASASGEPPARRTGTFRLSWKPKTSVIHGIRNNVSIRAYIESSERTDNGRYLLGEILENGAGRLEPRPYRKKIQDKAKSRIVKIMNEPYV